MERNLCYGLLILILLFSINSTAFADDGPTFYGAFKVSLNSTNDGDESAISVSNNDSRIGWKGSKKVKEDLDVIYQLEMGFDTTEREKFNSGRNSFLGVKGAIGKVMLGQHDTPLKDTRDHGAELFDDTIAGVRSIISAIGSNGDGDPSNGDEDIGAKLDDRAKNAVMYFSPKFNNTQLFVLHSSDMDPGDEVVDDNDNDLTSASIMHLSGPLYIGIGYQKKSKPSPNDDITATRVAFSYKFGAYQVGGIAESADAGDNNPLTRDAYALNIRYNMDANTWVGFQIAKAEEYDGSSDTGATNMGAGIVHMMDKSTKVYVVASNTNNQDNASFGLAQGGNQDRVKAYEPGDRVSGVSAGMEYKF